MTLNTAHTEALSYGQQALWFLHRLAPTSTAYNFVFAVRIVNGTTDELLRRVVQQLVDRHTILRTVYKTAGGTPLPQLLPSHEVAVESLRCSGTSRSAIRERLADLAYRPFDLEHGPVFRVAIVTTFNSERFLLLTAHHIAVDFESLGLLLSDLGEFHRAARVGQRPSLPAVPWQYADFVRWQRALLNGPEHARLWAYWRDELAPPLPVAPLPVDHPRSPVQSFRGSTVTFELDVAAVARVSSFARECEVTTASVVLAAFQSVLHEWTGQNDLLVGYVTPGRPPEFASVVGYFVNPVVVRTRVDDGDDFRSFIKRVQASVDGAWAHRDFPFPLLVERVNPKRDGGASPLVQVLFAMYDLDEASPLPLLVGAEGVCINVGDLQLESVPLEHRGAMLDLTLIGVRTGGHLTVHLQYNADLFERSTISDIAGRVQQHLRAVSVGPTAKAGRARPAPTMDFSLFFFANDDGSADAQKYRLLLEAAKFADRHGFSAVWTPERHFHRFGGIYPNPAVTGAALATVTERLQIRAGSVVLPLHHPARVAEEWSVVDNLSNGRVAVSFASGWHANDFVLAPGNFEQRREIMAREITTVRKLWRGEAITYMAGDGRPAEITVWPRPVQPELPIWVTAFGSPDTFHLAGQLGAGLLTHLLGQTIDELAAKIELYQRARRDHGFDPAGGKVAVMLHTFVGDDVDAVRRTVRAPFLEYLRSSVDLARIGEQAGLSSDGQHYAKANVDAFLEATFIRYFGTNTLFGTPETCLPLVDALRAAGVTEIACLIDFGLHANDVLPGLAALARLNAACSTPRQDTAAVTTDAERHRAVAGVRDRVQLRRQSLARHPRGSRDRDTSVADSRKDGRG